MPFPAANCTAKLKGPRFKSEALKNYADDCPRYMNAPSHAPWRVAGVAKQSVCGLRNIAELDFYSAIVL
jgi:hypothetical protein